MHASTGPGCRVQRRRVLVIDDEVDGLQALEILLTWAGHDVQVAASGEAGLRVADDFFPDVILLDIGMPDVNGYEICRRFRRTPAFAHTRIYALSGFAGQLHDTRCSEAGFTAQLMKPVDVEALLELV